MNSIEQAWHNWKMCLKGDDSNSLFNQIILMFWDTAVFRVIDESLNIKIRNNPTAPKFNEIFFSFIIRNYLNSQSSYIRRLTEATYSISGTKGIYSLGSIINDIQKYQFDLTREKYFELKKVLYGSSLKSNRIRKDNFQRSCKGVNSGTQECDWLVIEDTHNNFDLISNTKKENRNPGDHISSLFIEVVKAKLDHCKRINNYVNKFVAHSSTPQSRNFKKEEEYQITLNDIWLAHQIIYKIFNALSILLFSEDNIPLAYEHSSFYEFWSEPVYFDEDLENIESVLDFYRDEIDNWRTSCLQNMQLWINQQEMKY